MTGTLGFCLGMGGGSGTLMYWSRLDIRRRSADDVFPLKGVPARENHEVLQVEEPSPDSWASTILADDREFASLFEIACDALLLVSKGSSERDAVTQSWSKSRRLLGQKREALALVLDTVSQQDLMDDLIRRALPGRRLRPETQCLLRLITEIITDRSEATQIKRLEHSLRNIIPPELVPIVEVLLGTLALVDKKSWSADLSDIGRVAIETHHPTWWVEYCFRLFGRGEALDLLGSASRRRYVRVNSLRNRGRTNLPKSTSDWSSTLQKTAEKPMYILKVAPSSLSNYFSNGLFQLQALASFLAVKVADPKPREKVLDLCAAPGAKTSAAAQLMRNRGRIVSVDYSHRRMRVWKQETERLGVTIAEPIIADATTLALNEKFDLVIIDPPCTGTGVLDHNPSMKWRLSEKSLKRLSNIQQQMLDSIAPRVAARGRILYSTCSLTEEENELLIIDFLKRNPEFEISPSQIEIGSPGLRGLSGCRRFYPHRDGTAGYFIARMDRLN